MSLPIFHPDHAFFVFDGEVFDPKIPLFGPEENKLIPELQVITSKFEINGFSITPFPVIHALRLKSLAYLIERNNKKLFITGDVAWIEKAELKNLPKVDAVITEATFIEKGGRINRHGDKIYGHTGVPDLIRIFKPFTNQIILTHFGEWFFYDIPKALKILEDLETEDVQIIPATDGMEIQL